jgi:Glycosyl hydrolase family 26
MCRRILLALVVVAAAIIAATARAGSTAACGKLLPPVQGVYFGAYAGWDFAPGSFDDVPDPAHVRSFESLTGTHVAWAPWSISWHDRLVFPTSHVERVWRAGYVPQLRVFTFPTQDYAPNALPQSAWPGPITHSEVAAGKYDDQLKAFADAARNTDIPVFFDYDGEMNNAHPWGGRYEGNTALHFRDAYRHIIDVFRAEGATNVTFLIQYGAPNGYSPGSYWQPFEQFANYYPGDDYIDWISLSVYGSHIFGTGPNATFEQALTAQGMSQFGYAGAYAEATALTSKPLAIEELGFNDMPSEAAKSQWVEDASAALQSGRYARIDAIDWWAQNKENGRNWDGWPFTQTFADGLRQAFAGPFFEAKAQFSGDCSPLKPTLRVKKATLSWAAIPNAASYEVWRGPQKVATTSATTFRATKRGTYRVRAVNIVGVGAFSDPRRAPSR